MVVSKDPETEGKAEYAGTSWGEVICQLPFTLKTVSKPLPELCMAGGLVILGDSSVLSPIAVRKVFVIPPAPRVLESSCLGSLQQATSWIVLTPSVTASRREIQTAGDLLLQSRAQ